MPVIVMVGDDATLLCDGGKQREQVIPSHYHELKTLGHLAFGTQLTLMANGSGCLTELTATELHEKRAQIQEVQAIVSASPSGASCSLKTKAPEELLCRARTLIDSVLAEGAVDFQRQEEHIRALAAHALETAQLAVCIELEQVHAVLARWRNDLGEKRWAGMYVVICGAHQPRYREAVCQYALDLLARHIVDQRASSLLFGERRRLQEDLLADAASAEVGKLLPKSRHCPRVAQRRRPR